MEHPVKKKPVFFNENLMLRNTKKYKGKIGTNHMGAVKTMLPFFAKQLTDLSKAQEISPDTDPGFKTTIGGLKYEFDCTRKTVKNRLNALQQQGVITKRENHGKYGIRIWFDHDLIFKDQRGFENYTSATEKTYLANQNPSSEFNDRAETTRTYEVSSQKKSYPNNSTYRDDKISSIPGVKMEKFTPYSSCQELKNINTTDVNKLITTKTEYLRSKGVQQGNNEINIPKNLHTPVEQSVLPVPSGMAEKPRTPPRTSARTKQSSTQKNRQSEAAPKNRVPHTPFSEPPIPKKDNSGGARRAFSRNLIQKFWAYARKILFWHEVINEEQERVILNNIWASVFNKLHSQKPEDEWMDIFLDACIKSGYG